LTEAIARVLHISRVEHLPAILASVIAHDLAFCTMVIFQGFNWFVRELEKACAYEEKGMA